MDVSAFYTEIGQLLNDASNQRWSQPLLLSRMNLAATDVLIHTNAVKTKETLTPVSGTSTVSLDSDTIDVIRVWIMNSSGEWKKLNGMLREQLDFEDPNWMQRDNGEPLVYWWDGTNQQLNMVPAPDSEWAQTNGLNVWEVQKPAAMTASSDVPFSSNAAMIPYHLAIAHWVVAQCWMDDATPEALGKSKFHRSDDFQRPGKYEMEIKKIWKKFDAPEDIPARILWKPQGGRASNGNIFSKANPLGQ